MNILISILDIIGSLLVSIPNTLVSLLLSPLVEILTGIIAAAVRPFLLFF